MSASVGAQASTHPSAATWVLVVDDNADNRDLLARRLGRAGYSVVTAEDGWRALDLLQHKRFDLVVLDLMMPGIQGLEVLERIRQRFTKLELPVLIATAKLESAEAVRALELGANDYVTKPLDFPIVKARIESQLQTREQATSMVPPPAIFLADGTAAPGSILDGKFEVLATLGSGGFAVVFKARQLSTGQIVSLKVMRPNRIVSSGSASVELARFEREMDLIGTLKHPHIVQLIDSGALVAEVLRQDEEVAQPAVDDNVDTKSGETLPIRTNESPTQSTTRRHRVPYIAMEYLDGQPLSQIILEEAPMRVDRIIELVLPVISAVGAAHAAGVIHRDVKPPNIIVTHVHGRPHPKVLDFGIAKLVGDDVRQITTDERFLGTPEYMSPEQAQGDAELDGRCDQYTLAVILYEALTGVRPFRSDSFIRLMHMIMRGDCVPPSEIVSTIPRELEAVILRAMHADREMRYSSVCALGRALSKFATEEVASRWKSALDGQSDPAPAPVADSNADTISADAVRPAAPLPRPTPASAPERKPPSQVPVPLNLIAGTAIGFVVGMVLAWLLF